MTDLTSLIEKLEKAEGPDREIDCHLWVMSQGGDSRMNYVESASKCFVWERGLDGMWVRSVVNFRAVPTYTSAIDAAVSLANRVLPGFGISIDTHPVYGDWWDAAIFNQMPMTISNARKQTGPLALCLATLRALQQKGGTE